MNPNWNHLKDDERKAAVTQFVEAEHADFVASLSPAKRKAYLAEHPTAAHIPSPRPTVTPPAPVTKPTPLPKTPPVRKTPEPKPTVNAPAPTGAFVHPNHGIGRAINANLKLKQESKK